MTFQVLSQGDGLGPGAAADVRNLKRLLPLDLDKTEGPQCIGGAAGPPAVLNLYGNRSRALIRSLYCSLYVLLAFFRSLANNIPGF